MLSTSNTLLSPLSARYSPSPLSQNIHSPPAMQQPHKQRVITGNADNGTTLLKVVISGTKDSSDPESGGDSSTLPTRPQKKNLLVNTQFIPSESATEYSLSDSSEKSEILHNECMDTSSQNSPSISTLSTSQPLMHPLSVPSDSARSSNLFSADSVFDSIQKKSQLLSRIMGKQKAQPDSPYPHELLAGSELHQNSSLSTTNCGATNSSLTNAESHAISECCHASTQNSDSVTNTSELAISRESHKITAPHHLDLRTKFYNPSRLFWFGTEDPSHVKYIINRYAETYIDQKRAVNSRAPMLYVGKIKRIIIEDLGTQIRSFDEIEIYMQDDLPLGTQFTKREVIFCLTVWDADGTPVMDRSRRITNHHQMWPFRDQIEFPHKDDISYLYSLPEYRHIHEYHFHSSRQSYQVTYNGAYHKLLLDCSQITQLSKKRKRKNLLNRKVDVCDHEEAPACDDENAPAAHHYSEEEFVHEPTCSAYTPPQPQRISATDEEECVTPPTNVQIRATFLLCTCSAGRRRLEVVNFDELSPTEKLLKSLSPPLITTDDDDFDEEPIILQVEKVEDDECSFDQNEIQQQNARILEDLNHSPLFMSQFDHAGCTQYFEDGTSSEDDEEDDESDEDEDDDDSDEEEDEDDDDDSDDSDVYDADNCCFGNETNCCAPSTL